MKTLVRATRPPRPAWKVEAVSRNVHRVRFTLKTVKDEAWFLLLSDAHWDNPHCRRDVLEQHLDLAMERGAGILSFGDWFCAMQGKYDKRSNKSALRPEHKENDYLDSLVRTSAEWLQPYSKNLILWGLGNHETAILKNHETNLNERMVERLRQRGSPVQSGGFSGFVVFNMNFGNKAENSFKLFYHHGHGGGGPVTRDVIQHNRRAVYLADADVVYTGHTHDSWQMPIARVRLTNALNIEHCRQIHVKGAGYKDEYEDGYGGWHIERGAPPKPVGGQWLHFYRQRVSGSPKADFEVIEAK